MGHHFSSIAGAGPITGPIGAAMFGWLPVTLWVLVGGIFFGGVHDFGALFASARHNGQSIGEIISANMSKRAKQLFIIFSYLTLILVVAAFAAIVASTFGATIENGAVNMEKSAVKASVAMVSMLFIVAVVGIVGAHPDIDPNLFPAYTGFSVDNGNGVQYLFPILFTTVACGAISGFHSLVSSGTTSKQLDKESDAKPIAYGGMLLECVLAIITLCAIAYARETGHIHGATDIFAGGIAAMIAKIPGLEGAETMMYTLLILTYSAFCLTSLDTATRLARFMFQEFWLEPGETPKDIKGGFKKLMVNPYFATILTVVLGVLLGMNGFMKIWGLFGAANQLLAGIGLLAVAAWLGNAGKNNKMFLFPMTFMMIVTLASLVIIVRNQIGMIMKGGADWGPYAQAGIGTLLIVLALELAVEGYRTVMRGRKGGGDKAERLPDLEVEE